MTNIIPLNKATIGLTQQIESLTSEIFTGRQEIKTDNVSMTIGEIINLYISKDIELSPSYQRLFRWSDEQKSRLIESILLGIPLPSIFVAQKQDAKWDVVDGLQRLSTILQLTGDLGNHSQLTLTQTSKLPSLKGLNWQTIGESAQRIIKRTKLNISIILTENSIKAQYELFQRLNTGGVHLEPQEIRNCLIIMLNNDFYEKINTLKRDPNIEITLALKDSKFEIEYHMELLLRYFIAKHNQINFNEYKISTDLLSEFIDRETINLIKDDSFDIQKEIRICKRVFSYLAKSMGDQSFQKYNPKKDIFERGFSNASFEAITSGMAHHIAKIEAIPHEQFINIIKEMYQNPSFKKLANRGTKAITRIQGMIKFSEEFFRNEVK